MTKIACPNAKLKIHMLTGRSVVYCVDSCGLCGGSLYLDHPTCETCGHFVEKGDDHCDGKDGECYELMCFVEIDDYCNHHTELEVRNDEIKD